MKRVWEAAAALHQHVVHFDLYPSNIMWRPVTAADGSIDYVVRVIDWDAVHPRGARLAPRVLRVVAESNNAAGGAAAHIAVTGLAGMTHADPAVDRRTLAVWAWAAVYGGDILRVGMQSSVTGVLNAHHKTACAGAACREPRACTSPLFLLNSAVKEGCAGQAVSPVAYLDHMYMALEARFAHAGGGGGGGGTLDHQAVPSIADFRAITVPLVAGPGPA